MKSYKKIAILLTALGTLSVSSCKKLLEQSPKANITPQFFTTSGGVLGGITGVYSDLRNLWGTEGFLYYCQFGVDENIVAGGSSTGGNAFATYNNYVRNYTDVYNALYGLFSIAYQDINTLNGVLQYGPTAFTDVPTRTAYLAQAKFLRAFYYYHLVETFGAVPLHTTFITEPTLSDSRAPIADVYALIIKDLTEASTELQSRPGETIASTGAVSPFSGHAATKATALYLLSKVYLTRGWSSAAQPNDFQNALTTAQSLINNRANYGFPNGNIGLYANYADAYNPANDANNTEDLFAVEHSTDPKYGDYSASPSSGKVNGWAWFFRPNYPTVNASYPSSANGSPVMTRDLTNGRPFFRCRPNFEYVDNIAFADKTNDFRYWNTFQTTWIANNTGVTTPRGTLTVGTDTAIWMPPYDPGATKRAAFKGVIFMRPSLATAAQGTNANPFTTSFFPSIKKFDDPNRPNVNDASQRPNVLFRFSEVYLIAAEAAFKMGDNATAAAMINVLRTRAAARPAGAPAAPSNAVTNMQITPAQVTIDFILDERSRELYGESLRWWDLVRTQSLVRRVKLYNTEAANNVQDFEVLRPIPQTEIDLVTIGPKFPQNPGF
ncbi:RagB/SusD family nutrient uptake outer membrane protein [Mucilaginibacter robiniae]|uniref:RagB/SusD family nutrient uptake outer membrane protein n=1 Tax=Mucilaginibacter robiniae TaxID=2728022 RepID=A0A7L5DWT9_9SPHI|nr:RagB/SusD family nutrient uptake outer membrane protein [Mucilaginibacter robiniae]QJD95562.1 RagB/SusD family nutrient uptake outer membrane protein [Mucilaginibacter robiniae]